MRFIITILLLLGSVNGFAQRPWLLRSPMTAGPNPTVVSTSNSVYVFDKSTMRSFDHGVTWEPITTISGATCAIADFTAGLTLLASYTMNEKTITMYFSNGGSTWTSFTTIPNAQKPIALAASSTEWYLACEKSNVIYRFGDNLETVSLPAGADVADIKYWQSLLLASDTKQGLFISSDKGASWKLVPIANSGPIHATSTGVYLATNNGVAAVDVVEMKASIVGNWPTLQRQPSIIDIDSYLNTLYAYSDEGAYQMYRLQGQIWEPVGYQLPGKRAGRSASVLAVDAGYAVLGHAIAEGFVDSAGVYVYDLNDFSDVAQDPQHALRRPYIADNHLYTQVETTATVEIWSMRGECLHSNLYHTSIVELPALTNGVYLVRVHAEGSTAATSSMLYAR